MRRALVTAVIALLSPGALHALDVSAEVGLQSAFVWRGMILNDEAVLQPSLALSHGGFTAGAWGNLDLTDERGTRGEVDEIDYWISHTWSGTPIELTLTAYEYTFPASGAPSTRELWASATWKTSLSPTLLVVRDVGAVDGWYTALTVSHAVAIGSPRLADGIVLTAGVGHGDRAYCRGYYPGLGRSVTDLMLGVEAPLSVGPGTLTVRMQIGDFTRGAVRSPGYERRDRAVVGGVVFSLPLPALSHSP